MEKRIIILIGAPNSGKDTRAEILSRKLGIPVISTGKLVEDTKDEDILKIKEEGGLVSNHIVYSLLYNRTIEDDCANGFIANGTPRIFEQIPIVDDISNLTNAKITDVINFEVSDEELRRRARNRRICPYCGHVTSVEHGEQCPICFGQLAVRKDDKLEVFERRLEIYKQNTQPILDHYRALGLVRNLDANDNKYRILDLFK